MGRESCAVSRHGTTRTYGSRVGAAPRKSAIVQSTCSIHSAKSFLASREKAHESILAMSSEETNLELPESALDEIVRRLEARIDSRRREREGRSESELGEH